VDAEYARGTAYANRIVHGAFQVGLASALIGMHLPGRHVLLANVSARFPAPLYFPCTVRVRGEITSWQAETHAGQIKISVVEQSRQVPTAEIVISFTLHEPGRPSATLAPAAAPRLPEAAGGSDRKVVLLTGAGGGLGSELAASLAQQFDVLAATRQPLPDHLLALPGLREWRIDLAEASLDREAFAAILGDRRLFGIVHAAWPGAPLGGLLQAQNDVVEGQILFGATTTIRLARLLFESAGPEGGRFVAISSIVASQKPVITLSAYSLGKAAMEGAVKLLAPELARRNITINAVCPSLIPTGMNKHKGEQQRKIEASRIPLGRLCEPRDIGSLVDYLLSPEAGFISGQIIGLSGGQL